MQEEEEWGPLDPTQFFSRPVVPNLGAMQYFLEDHGTNWKLSSNYNRFYMCVLLHIHN